MSHSHAPWHRPLGAVVAATLAMAMPQTVDAAGRIEALPGPAAVVVAAPHGGFDLHSDEMARQAALLGGFGYLLASGFRTRDLPINVNRPSVGVGLSPDQETRSPEATAVFQRYADQLTQLAPQLYVEFHGNSRKESAAAIEVACKGISASELAFLKTVFDARLALMPPGVPRLPLRIEGLETVHFGAAANKRDGAISLVARALHFEVPYVVRADPPLRSRYATALALTLYAFARHTGLVAIGPVAERGSVPALR